MYPDIRDHRGRKRGPFLQYDLSWAYSSLLTLLSDEALGSKSFEPGNRLLWSHMKLWSRFEGFSQCCRWKPRFCRHMVSIEVSIRSLKVVTCRIGKIFTETLDLVIYSCSRWWFEWILAQLLPMLLLPQPSANKTHQWELHIRRTVLTELGEDSDYASGNIGEFGLQSPFHESRRQCNRSLRQSHKMENISPSFTNSLPFPSKSSVIPAQEQWGMGRRDLSPLPHSYTRLVKGIR